MGKNSMYTLPEAWEAITKVKSDFNRKKLEEIYHMVSVFIPLYQNKPIKVLLTPHFAQHYLPILRKIIGQSAGKKLLLSFSANPWVGVTKSIQWFIWMPTRVGSKAAMSLLQSYVVELEKQAIVPAPKVMCSVKTQTDFPSPPNKQDGDDNTDDKNDGKHGDKNTDKNTPPDFVPDATSTTMEHQNDDIISPNDSAMTSGVACGQDTYGFDISDGSGEDMILARALELSKLDDTQDSNPSEGSPIAQASPMQLSTPARPSKLTKGSRKTCLKDSGINFSAAGILEESRRARNSRQQSDNIQPEVDLVDIDDINIVDDVFDESWEEIPDLE